MNRFTRIALISLGLLMIPGILLGASDRTLFTTYLKMTEPGGTDVVTIVPSASSGTYTLTLPVDDGSSGQTLSTDGSGGLSWASSLTNPMTTTGDIIYSSDNSGTPARLGIGSASSVLHGGTTPSYSAVSLSTDVTGVLPTANGGTGQNSSATFPTSGTVATVPSAGATYSNGTALQTTGSFTGAANKVVGVNSGETATEYKTVATGTSGTDFAVAFAAGSITLNLPDAGSSARGAVTTGSQNLAGEKTFDTGVKFATSGGTAAQLNFYEETTQGLSFTGARSVSATAVLRRIGKIAILELPGDIGASCVASSFTVPSATMPTRYRPTNAIAYPIKVQDNGATLTTVGELIINSNGAISISKAFGSVSFTNGANCGWFSFAVSWTIP